MSRPRQVHDYEIIDHGYMLPDYFEGCGVAFTAYVDVATGCGSNAKEAYLDALEQLAQQGWDVDTLPARPQGIRARDKVPAKYPESNWYVSVRIR